MDTLQSGLQFDNFDPTRPASSEIKPPFPYIEINWHNGFQTSESKNAKYFGGWQISEENAGAAIGTFGKLYNKFGEMEQWAKGKGEGTYPARSTRFIVAAPIATRVKWYDGRDGQKGSSKTQILAYLAEVDNKVVTPYAPALIHGGSYHAGVAVTAAFQQWTSHVNSNREAAKIGNIPAWAFYGYYGTFGDKRLTKEVGKSGNTNFIVPCQLKLPSDPTLIRDMYVGDEIASEIMKLRKLAQAWLDDAKSKKQQPQEEPQEPNPFGDEEPQF